MSDRCSDKNKIYNTNNKGVADSIRNAKVAIVTIKKYNDNIPSLSLSNKICLITVTVLFNWFNIFIFLYFIFHIVHFILYFVRHFMNM